MQSARLDGDLQGTLTGAGAVDLDRSRFASAATFVFRGAAGECGSGTAVIHRFEVGAASGGELRWEIAPGFGSGALTHLTGGGAGTFVESPPTSDQVASSWSGRISCREPLDVPMLDARPSGTAVTAQVHYPMPPVGAPACDNKDCVFPSTWEPAYTGDWTGGSHAAGTAVLGAPSASGVPYTAVAVERFTGSIADCGSGSVLIRSVSEFDGVRATTRWEIVANFASGDLLRTHGRGDASSRREADGAYAGRLRGAVSCT
jgi:hypothetical protein